MINRETDYEKYHKKKRTVKLAIGAALLLALIIYFAGPLAKQIRNGAPGLYDFLKKQTGTEAIEYYANEVREGIAGDAEIAEYAITPNMRPIYEGATLSVDDETGRISSSIGRFTDDFSDLIKNSNAQEYQINADASEIAIEIDGALYHIDAELNIFEVKRNVYSYRLCHDGGYLFYITDEDYALYAYEVDTGISNLIDTEVFSAEISPNGEYVVYKKDTIDARYLAIAKSMASKDDEKTIITRERKNVSPVFVSADGRTAYYYTYEGYDDKYANPSVYCYHDGKETRVYGEVYPTYYTNVSAEELLFYDITSDKLIYYNPAMSGGVCIMEIDHDNIVPAYTYTKNSRRGVIVDTNNIRDGILFRK